MLKKVLKRFSQDKFHFLVENFRMPEKNDVGLVLIVFSIAFFLRIFYLNQFPIGMTHDELNYIISAKSLFLTGNFLPQTAPAVYPTATNPQIVIAEIPSLLLMPFVGPTNFSLFTSRLVGALLTSFSVVVIYFLVLELLKNKLYAFLSAAVYTINPWNFLMGRTVFEVSFYIFFFLLGLLILIKKRGWSIFYSLPFYLMGFFCYTGGQIVFYLFTIITLIYHFLVYSKGRVYPYIFFAVMMTVLFFAYLYLTLHNQSISSRGGELYLPISPVVSQEVDKERLTSVPFYFNNLFINKATVYVRGFLSKYLDAYSPSTLFLNGEYRASYSYQKHGTFYSIDFVFILLGLAVLFQRYRKEWLMFVSIIAIAPITSGLSTVEHSYSQRAGLMYPFLIVLVAVGLSYVLNLALKRKFGKMFLIILSGIYLFSFINLLHIYFFRFPVYASDGWFFQDRLLARYIQLVNLDAPGKKIYVYTSEPRYTFEEYLFFTNTYKDQASAKTVNDNLELGVYRYGNVIFLNECPKEGELNDESVEIYDILLNCKIDKRQTLRITRFQDVAEKYLIKNDEICKNISIGSYVKQVAFKNFDVSSQFNKDFCENWLTKL